MSQNLGYPVPPKKRIRFRLFALALAAGLVLVGVRLCRPDLLTKGLTGDFLNAVAVPGPGGAPRLWILSDGSFQYVQTVKRPGYMSIGRKCKSCKTWMYVYDPATRTVLARFRANTRSIILQSWMIHRDGKIWAATDAYDRNEPRLFIYSVDPPGLARETPEIIASYPELASGLIKIRLARDPDRFLLDTKDGRVGLVLDPTDGRLYANEAEYKQATAAGDDDIVTVFALGSDDGGPRKFLFRVRGPRGRVRSGQQDYLIRHRAKLHANLESSVEPLAPGDAYIEGLIVQQEADGCLVLHQDAAGKRARRRLTRLDAAGNALWTAGPDQLFKEMDVDLDKNAMSAIDFLKNNLEVTRSGNVVLLQLRGVGAIGFDGASGRRLWDVRL